MSMIKAYNFAAAWQLFPEKGQYEQGDRPKSGTYTIEANHETHELTIHHNWVTLENEAYSSHYIIVADGALHPYVNNDVANQVQVHFIDSITFEIRFYQLDKITLHITHEIIPNGYLKISQQGFTENNTAYTNVEVYFKQMSVLPYAAAVSGAVIKANEEGIIKHKALTAMEEQTNMQLQQIRKQIELLALQAQEIAKRKELSLKIYEAKLQFKPNIGQTYYLYEKKDGTHMLSLIAPGEWGNAGPFKKFVAPVKLLADHTWIELV